MTGRQGNEGDKAGAIEDEAIAWLVRMRGPDAVRLRTRFEAWLEEAPEHRRAHEWASRHFDDAGMLKQSARHGTGRRRKGPGRRLLVAGWTAAAAACLLLILTGNPLGKGGGLTAPLQAEPASPLVTQRGEIRTFRLRDGSSVTLDTDSRLTFSMDVSARRFDLERGKARFAIARDARPFIVTAGAGKIAGEIATFDVGYEEERRIMVSLISGRADVGSDVQPAARPALYVVPGRQVAAGQRLAYRASDFTALPTFGRMGAVADRNWPSGWVEYRSVPLGLLVEQANRYAARPVLLEGSEIASLEATGRFRLTDSEAFAGRIAEVFDLELSRRPDGIHLSRR